MAFFPSRPKHLLLLLPSFLFSVTAQQCYWPSGALAQGYTSCNEAAGVSNCCNQDSVCLDNGFCMNQKSYGNRLQRGACTDQDWGAGCTQICKDIYTSNQVSLILVGDFDPGSYCCGNIDLNEGRCQFGSGGNNQPFRGPANGAVIWDRKTGATDLKLILSNSTTSETVTVTVAPSGTGTSLPGSSGNGGSSAQVDSCPKNNEVAIGAGVGVGLGAALALVGGLLFWQMRQRREAERKLEEMMTAPSSYYDVDKFGGGNGYIPADNKPLHRSELPGTAAASELRA